MLLLNSMRISAYWKRRFNREMFCYGEKAYVIIAVPRTNWPAARHSSPKPDKGRRVSPIGAGLLREVYGKGGEEIGGDWV